MKLVHSISLQLVAAIVFAFVGNTARSQEFRLLAWNIESNRPGQSPVSDAKVIASQLEEILKGDATKSQIVVLSELDPQDLFTYTAAIERGFAGPVDLVTSGSGGFRDTDSLLIAVDQSRFEIINAVELHRWRGQRGNFAVDEPGSETLGALRARSPLAVKIKDKATELEFWVVGNHLARGEADLRTEQARMLVAWAKDLGQPAISAGDHNFDFDFHTQQGNEAYAAMIDGDIWHWVKPDPLVDSNWSQDRRIRDKDVDRYPDSILDFVFIANAAKNWQAESDVIVRPGDFPDNDKTSDHRPIFATFKPFINSSR